MSIIEMIGAMAEDAREASRQLRRSKRDQKDDALKLMAKKTLRSSGRNSKGEPERPGQGKRGRSLPGHD